MLPSIFNGNTFQSVFKFCSDSINSTCADMIHVDVVTGTALVKFKSGHSYQYTNVSRRAITKFVMDDARSLGKFVNRVLSAKRVTCSAV